jgi:hypothetical protein
MYELKCHLDSVVAGLTNPTAYEKLCALLERAKQFHPVLMNPVSPSSARLVVSGPKDCTNQQEEEQRYSGSDQAGEHGLARL